MNELQDLVEVQPVSLENLVAEPLSQPLSLPSKAVKNRAALTALLEEDPANMLSSYQTQIAEAEQGEDVTRSLIMNKAIGRERPKDIGVVIAILGDQSASLEQKKLAISAINDPRNKDSSVIVGTNAFIEPSEGENIEQAEVRMTGADQFKNILEYNREVQKIRNLHSQTSTSTKAQTVLDFMSMLLPYSVNKYGVSTLKPIADELQLNISSGKAAVLPGTAMSAIKEAMLNVPAGEKLLIAQKVVELVENNSSLFLNSDNNFVELAQLKQVLDGDYSTFDKVLDNASGVLDTIGLGGLIAAPTKFAKGFIKGFKGTSQEKVALRSVSDATSPIAPLTVMKDANPSKARAMLAVIDKSDTDEVAEALAGASKAEVIVAHHMPQPASLDGTVATKVVDPARDIPVIVGERGTSVIDKIFNKGSIEYSDAELRRAQSHIFNDMKDIDGVTLHDNMLTVGVNDKGVVTVDAIYGTTEGGFLKAEDALAQVRYSLKEFGILENELSLMRREGGEYFPISLENAKLQDGDYVVKVGFDKRVTPGDVVEMDVLDVKRNFFDRFPVLRSKISGTMANMLLDASSMLNKRITGAAVTSADRAATIDKSLIAIYDSFATKVNRLSGDRQNKVWDYLKEANSLGVEKNINELVADGFNKVEIDAIHDWREGWDTIYLMENYDLVRTLEIQGYQLLESKNGSQFVAKSFSKNHNIGKVLDPTTDTFRALSKQEVDELYASGGSYAQLRRPVTIDGNTIETIIVRNTPDEYLRGLRSSDQILTHRKGYYQVTYQAPHFIEEIVRGASGLEERRRVIGVAGTKEEAEHIIKRRASTEGRSAEDFNIRDDIKDMRVDTDAYWDLQSASGRIAQRYRGDRLEEASTPLNAFDGKYMLDPLEAATRASRSISGRVALVEALEASKARALQQYADYFPLNKSTGQRQWVSDSNSLLAKTSLVADKELANARTTVEYLNYLTRGYDNSVDVGVKQLMNVFANIAANFKSPTMEKAFNYLGSTAPFQFLKNGVFVAYLATNPLRQFIVQGHQGIRMMGLAPRSFFKGMLDSKTYLANKILPISKLTDNQKDMIKFVEDSGMLDAVDRSNLVRGAITDLTKSGNPVTRFVGKAISIPRKIGFDLGEQTNLLMHLTTLRNRAIAAGKDVKDLRVRDEIYSEARAISYDMNFAGDMPYNQNAMNLALQFFQVPHKAMMSSLTNRRVSGSLNPFTSEFYALSKNDKLKLVVTDSLLWGIPGAIVFQNLIGKDALPEDPDLREAVLFGLESYATNAVLSEVAGTDVNIDFSGFAPYNTEGFANLAHAITSGGFSEFIANSPAFTLYAKEGSRFREAMGRFFKYTGFIDTEQGHDPETMLSVMSGVAEMSSGWSNYLKARAIVETGKLQSKKGGVLNEDASYMLAVAKLFGFGTQEDLLKYQATTTLRNSEKAMRSEVDSWYKSYITTLARDQKLSNQDPEWVSTVLGAAKLPFKNNLEAMNYIQSKLSKDMLTDDQRIIKGMIKDAGLLESQDISRIKNLKILKDEDLNKAIKLMEDIRTANEQLKEME